MKLVGFSLIRRDKKREQVLFMAFSLHCWRKRLLNVSQISCKSSQYKNILFSSHKNLSWILQVLLVNPMQTHVSFCFVVLMVAASNNQKSLEITVPVFVKTDMEVNSVISGHPAAKTERSAIVSALVRTLVQKKSELFFQILIMSFWYIRRDL